MKFDTSNEEGLEAYKKAIQFKTTPDYINKIDEYALDKNIPKSLY